MRRYIRLFLCVCALAVAAFAYGQSVKWQDLYTVKKKDTIYGIAKKYDITIDDLMRANPGMQKSDYVLKKGDQLLIPFPSASKATAPARDVSAGATQGVSASASGGSSTVAAKKTGSVVNVGVMLPLHNVDGDGQRMVEFYRGLLMACDSLKALGINTSVHAWNVPIDGDVAPVLGDPAAKECNVIFGPLYTKQVKEIADFCRKHSSKLVIPFSISSDEVTRNDHIFQVYQSPEQLNNEAVNAFVDRFPGANVVIVDCNDATSNKGGFTSALRSRLQAKGIKYSITNLKSSAEMFAKAFDQSKRNVVVLNTGRSPELNSTLAKLNVLRASNPNVKISMFGYNEWLMYTKVYKDYFYKYDAYIPTSYYYNPQASRTANFNNAYRRWFKSDMRESLPRFAITGYDQAQFFIRGLHRYGQSFLGSKQQNTYSAMQTPLKFARVAGGGMQNVAFMLIHYSATRGLESISY